MKLPAYPRYKPSGVEWLGDVPEHWEVKRLKWVGEAVIGLTYSPTDVVDEGEGTLVLRASNIQGGRIVLDDNVFVSAEIPRKLRTKANDIVICTRNGSRDLVGKTGKISERESGLTFGAFTAVFRSSANDYMFYVFNSGLFSFQAGLYQTSTIFQLTNGTINAFQIPLPPPREQQAIAAFLDRETGRVDQLLAKKRELIERLKEKRTALISNTVARGLPPAAARAAGFPENPPLKPSGLDWLRDIPKHWEVKSLTRLTLAIRNGTSATQLDDTDNTVPVTRIESISGGRINFDKVGQVEWTPSIEGFRLKKGDILLSHINSLSMVGNCALFDSDQPLYSGMNLLRIQPERTIHAPWLWRVISSDGIRKEISARAKPAINQASVTTTQIKSLRLPVPPLAEQSAIAAYLDDETAKLDALVGKVEVAVERLQEHRTALITAAVTGKIDVRKAAA